ncbi:type II secretion system F family protein [Vibrio fluvialis]|uniref:Type II/IV secretion system protein TadC, associated with Flp pilus assembly n=1 Tax=Vibrio fluvialis PG41 TaxID=1336752 RepID=S7I1V9_VIBFL|nr:type II secretion system F family protein [Vibrio fluvialis]EPP21902.1 Type II/IV secretion system protein TadC, associated with Flp pilus assembly [Vibrio fluvialis PG41]WIE03734.1 type II secretion system F family protein [Vibrio fluvialis]
MDVFFYLFKDMKLNEETFILFMVLLSTMTVVVTIFLVIAGSRSSVQKRLDTIAIEDNRRQGKNSHLKQRVESLSPLLTPKNETEREDIRSKLIRAGFHHESAISYYYAIKFVTTFIGLILSLAYYLFSGTESNLFVFPAIGAGLGMFLPNVVLNKLMKKRQLRVKRGIPDALDLLVVCTESGLGLNMALKRVAQELAISHPDLADELDTVCLKIKAGYEMPHAFRDMVARTGLSELNGLVSMLSHASRVGGSISQTLRDYTEDYRDKRTQEVEEIAAKIPTKMVFPMLVCIWPGFFIVVVGPAALRLIDAFS